MVVLDLTFGGGGGGVAVGHSMTIVVNICNCVFSNHNHNHKAEFQGGLGVQPKGARGVRRGVPRGSGTSPLL